MAWTRRLELTFGTTTQAVATILAVYMAGLGLGALGAGRLADRRSPRDCVTVYAILETAIGVYGAVSLLLCDLVETVFYAVASWCVFLGFAELRRRVHRRRGLCTTCKYDLRGELFSGCPECGWRREDVS